MLIFGYKKAYRTYLQGRLSDYLSHARHAGKNIYCPAESGECPPSRYQFTLRDTNMTTATTRNIPMLPNSSE